MRNNVVKIALFLILFAGVAVFSFAETIFISSISFTRLYEQFLSENSGRDLEGISYDTSINYFPSNFPFGWYVKTTLGSNLSGTEWKGFSITSADVYSSTDIRLSIGPSFVLRAGTKLLIPISVGPIISNYREEVNSYYYDYYYEYYENNSFYEALNVGVLADVGIVLNPIRRFAIKTGVSVNWDFLRWEKGFNASTAFRTINSGEFSPIEYNAFKISLYFGMGLCFDNSKVKN